jgi:hypothetical protein
MSKILVDSALQPTCDDYESDFLTGARGLGYHERRSQRSTNGYADNSSMEYD